MSAIAALYGFCGRPNEPASVERMIEAMASRAPHGQAYHTAGSVSLAHGLLQVARNGLRCSDRLVATLDGRFDNRDHLLSQLDLDPHQDDVALLLAAYRRWGETCLDHLDGDFAFVLWDCSLQRLMAARDRLGVRPFYYYAAPDSLWIASHPAALLSVRPDLADEIDLSVMHAYCAGVAAPLDRTIHASIRRLPPAHKLVVEHDKLRITRYFSWSIASRRTSEPPERFAELLSASVTQRMDSASPVATLLSGGLDSSSIASLGARQRDRVPLSTYSQVFPGSPAPDERPYMDAVIAQGGIDPNFVPSSAIAPFDDIVFHLEAQASPFIAPNMATTGHMLRQIASDGFRVVLDGHGGDEVVSHGVAGLYDLAYHGRFLLLWRRLHGLARVERQSASRMFLGILKHKGPLRRFGIPQANLQAASQPDWLQCTLPDSSKVAANPGEEEIGHHIDALVGGFFVQGLEVLDKLAGSLGLELRYPFLQRDLIEWCLSGPLQDKLADGRTRALLRQGMQGILPDMVRTRRDKFDFSAHFRSGLLGRDRRLVSDVLAQPHPRLADYFDLPVLRAKWTGLCQNSGSVSGIEAQAIWRAVMIGIWLERRQTRPAMAEQPDRYAATRQVAVV